MNGTLALVGSGEYLPPMDAVDQFLLSRVEGERRVVCLPTAAGAEGGAVIARWSRMGVAHFTRLGAQAETVEIIDRATALEEGLAARIRAANFVYLSGGKPDYLYQALRETPAWAAILNVLERGGVVAGCSAGAMIMGAAIPRFRLTGMLQPAFNLLPGAVIAPHFDEFPRLLVNLLKWLIGPRALVGIEGNTALVCADSEYRVAGAGGVTIWNRHHKVRYTDGQIVPWP